MKFILYNILSILIVQFTSLYSQTGQKSKIENMLNAVSNTNIINQIQILENAGGHWSRVNFTPGNDSAAKYIYRHLKQYENLHVEMDTFYIAGANIPFDQWPLYNVIATLKGKKDSSKVIIAGAHLDCSASRMPNNVWATQWQTLKAPGADDNATGLAAIFEMARILNDTSYQFENAFTIKLIAFGAEETGPAYPDHHHGSKHYAEAAKARNEKILGMISVDMVGYNKSYHYQSIVADSASRWLGSKLVEVNNSYSIGLITNSYPFINATYSDHASFWEQGYPAILLIENAPPWNNNSYYKANPLYHTSYDTSASVNIALVAKVTKLTLAAVCSMADSVITGLNDFSPVASDFRLYQNFPNPFNPSTTIIFSLPPDKQELKVSLKLYDILGKEITTLTDEMKQPGTYSVNFNASGLPAGIYFYELKAGNFREVKKMSLIK